MQTRALALTAVAALSLGLAACGQSSNNAGDTAANSAQATVTEKVTETVADAGATDAAPSNEVVTSATDPADYLTQEEAEDVALKDAGVSRDEVTKWDKSELDADDKDKVAHWEVEFDVNTTEYEFDINATDGSIISKSIDTQ